VEDGRTLTVDISSQGRDEMNLAEFPVTVLADRAPKGARTLIFRVDQGQLTITGSDAYGLPTAPDADVIVALIQLTKLKNDFQKPTVTSRATSCCACSAGTTRSAAIGGSTSPSGGGSA
jgi:hypothetical protein